MSASPRPPPLPAADNSLRMLATVALAAVLGYLLWAVADVLVIIFAGLLLAVFLRGLSAAVVKLTGLPEGAALAAVLLLLGILVALIGLVLGAEILSQLDQLVPRIQKAWGQIRDELRQFDWGRTVLTTMSFKALAKDKDWVAWVTGGVFSGTLGVVASFLLILFIGLYAAAAPRTYVNGLLRLVPPQRRRRAAEVLKAVGSTLHWWLIGAFAKMAVVGIGVTIGLRLMDMPLALALGTLAFLFVFVPYVGPILASLPALLVAMALGPSQVAYVALLYLGVHAVEGYILSPLIDQRSVKVPPVLSLAIQLLLGASALGLQGIFFATPLTAVGMVLVKMLYIEDRLGECTDAVEGKEGAVCVPPRLPKVADRAPVE